METGSIALPADEATGQGLGGTVVHVRYVLRNEICEAAQAGTTCTS